MLKCSFFLFYCNCKLKSFIIFLDCWAQQRLIANFRQFASCKKGVKKNFPSSPPGEKIRQIVSKFNIVNMSRSSPRSVLVNYLVIISSFLCKEYFCQMGKGLPNVSVLITLLNRRVLGRYIRMFKFFQLRFVHRNQINFCSRF